MFFKRGRADKTEGKEGSSGSQRDAAARASGDLGPALAPAELRRTVDVASLGFKTTAELEPISGLIGQERALQARSSSAPTSRRTTSTCSCSGRRPRARPRRSKAYLEQARPQAEPTPADWVYVNNFDNPNRPQALRLPSGRAKPLSQAAWSRRSTSCARRCRPRSRATTTRPAAAPSTRSSGRPGGGARGAEPQGAGAEHRHHAHADRLRHGADARGQGGQARGVQRAARGRCARTSRPRSRRCRRSWSRSSSRCPSRTSCAAPSSRSSTRRSAQCTRCAKRSTT